MQISSEHIVIIVLTLTLMSILVIGFIISYVQMFNTRKKKFTEEKRLMEEKFHLELLHSKLEIQEEVFNNISKELHDNVGQLLSFASLQLGIANTQKISYNSIKKNIDNALEDLRNISKSLNGEYIRQFSISEFLHNTKLQFNNINNLNFRIEEIGKCHDLELSRKIILIRVFQEIVQNIVKHANATVISMIVDSKAPHELKVTITDNGKGFDINKTENKNGLGMINMKNRIEALNGSIYIQSEPGNGTSIALTIPI